MKKLVLKIFAAIVVVFLLLAILVPVFVDINHYKAEITTLVKNKTGLSLDIQGDLQLSILTGIEFSVDNISLSNGKNLIADIEHLSLKLTPAFLYSKNLTITSLAIKARALNIIIDKNGQYNFMPSSATNTKEESSKAHTQEMDVEYFETVYIKDIVLNIQKLNYQDHLTGDSIILNKAVAELSLLPVIDHYKLVIDQPSVIVNYKQKGKLAIKNIHLPHEQIKNLELSFTDNKGFLLTNTFHFSYIQKTAPKKGTQSRDIKFNMDNTLKLELVYPASDSNEIPWSKPERISIELSEANITDLKLIEGRYIVDAETLHMNIERQDLYASGQSKIKDLTINSILLSGDKIKVEIPDKRQYTLTHLESGLKNFPVFKKGHYLELLSKDFLSQFARQGLFSLKSSQLFVDKIGLNNFTMLIKGKQKEIVLSKLTLKAMDSVLESKGKIFWDKNDIRWHLNINSKKLNLEPVSRLMGTGTILDGYVSVNNDLSGTIGKGTFKILEGNVLVDGKMLHLNGFDLNKVLKDFQSSQSVGLLDVGAVVLLGPAGVLVTKGNDYRTLVNSVSNKGNTTIKQLHSEIYFSKGTAAMKDVAFSTDLYRLAIKGKIDTINNKFINFNVATVNKYGCPVYKEEVRGSLSDPRVKEVNVLVSSVVNPVQSVLRKVSKAMNIKCDKAFYKGLVKAPGQ